MKVFSSWRKWTNEIKNILFMEQKLTMDQYKLKDLMDATKIDVGKEVVEKLLPAVVQEAGRLLFDKGV